MAPRDGPFTIWTNARTDHPIRVSFERLSDLTPAFQVPDAEGMVQAAGHSPFAVGRNAHAVHPIRVSVKRLADLTPAFQVPHTDGIVESPRDGPSAVGSDAHVDPARRLPAF